MNLANAARRWCRPARCPRPLLATTIVLLAVGGCAIQPSVSERVLVPLSAAVPRGEVVLSAEQEMALGARTHAQMMRRYQPYQHPHVQVAVTKLGALLAVSHRPNLEYRFTVLDTEEVNAFALPGGYIYITRGLLAYLNSQAELAAILGHEIGHVTAQHAIRQHFTTESALGQVRADDSLGDSSDGVSSPLDVSLEQGYGRQHELEAHQLGAEYMARAGYDPARMLDVMGVLKDREAFEAQRARGSGRVPQNYHGLFPTHPDDDQDLQSAIAAAAPFKNAETKASNRDAFLRLSDGLVFGDSAPDGVVHGNRFFHLGLNFTVAFPARWRVQNESQRLLAVSPDNRAALILEVRDRGFKRSPRQFLEYYFAGHAQGRAVGEDAYTGIIEADTDFGRGSVRVSVVTQGERVMVLSGYAKGALPDKDIIDTLKSIHHLTPRERAFAAPKRIRVIRTGDTFAKLARNARLGRYGADLLRLINGLYPDGEPRAQQLIKSIE